MLSLQKVRTKHNVKSVGRNGKTKKEVRVARDLTDGVRNLQISTPVKKVSTTFFRKSDVL